MSLEYDVDTRLKDLAPVLDEYTEWFMRLVRNISYPDKADDAEPLAAPASFANWLEKAEEDNFEPELMAQLKETHGSLVKQADNLRQNSGQSKQSPAYEDFDHLVTLFEEFSHSIRRLEKDSMLEDSGLDPLTGLRSEAAMERDLKREMERLSRQGSPFILALVSIDYFDQIKDQDVAQSCIKKASELIKKSCRTYDDAYRLASNNFVLALKQASSTGGVKAMERLRKELEEADAEYEIEGQKIPLSLSSCIAEPLPGDDIQELLDNLKFDLDSVQKDDGMVLEYFEMSPLQKYAKEVQD